MHRWDYCRTHEHLLSGLREESENGGVSAWKLVDLSPCQGLCPLHVLWCGGHFDPVAAPFDIGVEIGVIREDEFAAAADPCMIVSGGQLDRFPAYRVVVCFSAANILAPFTVDAVLAAEREAEPRESLDSVKERLVKAGKLDG